jgi:GT2 family glycosyltransferase
MSNFNSPITFCISTFNNLPYLQLAVESVRKNSFYSTAPFVIYAENCTDGTNTWLLENKERFNLDYYIEFNEVPKGIGGGMNFCANKVQTEFIMFLHSDFYVSQNWDLELLNMHLDNPELKLWASSYRIEPDMFNSPSRPGTTIIAKNEFGEYYHNFQAEKFELWAEHFKTLNEEYLIPKGEGVSGLIKKSVWDEIGGNDPLFAPASWEDMDLFLRMKLEGVDFLLTGKSLVYHFGARGSHRLEENNGHSSERQIQSEKINAQKWLQKWGKFPIFDEYGMVSSLDIK